MKYAVIKCINGNFFIDSEGYTEREKAIVKFHGVCQALWNAEDVSTAKVLIADEQLNCVDGYAEFIHHEEPEPVEADAE